MMASYRISLLVLASGYLNFLEPPKDELPRIPIPRIWVNKGKKLDSLILAVY
jgi:hypothetical protein